MPFARTFDRNVQAGHGLVAAPAAAAPVIRTVLPAGTSVVVVSLDTTEAADLSGLTVGIDGAARASTGTAGASAAPVVIAARGRTPLLYDLAGPAPAAGQPGPVTVSVGTSPSWRLAGVMGGPGTAATTAPLLAASGAAQLLAPLLQAPTGSAQLNWSDAADAADAAARKEVG